MAGDTTFTFLDATGAIKTARAGSNVGGDLAPSAVLYDVNGNVLIGQKARAASLPVTLSTEDVAALTPGAAISGYATSANQATEITALGTLITQTDGVEASLVSILAKLIATPATEAKQDVGNTSLATLVTQTDTVEASLVSILAKISADPATQTTLAAILAKLIAAPATEAKQDVGNTSLATLVTQTDTVEASLVSILAKIIAAPATEAKQDTAITALGTLLTTAAFQARVNTLGQKTMANSTPVVFASDQSALALDAATLAALETINAAQSGTWTVQPGNTANTTPWLASPLATSLDVTLTRPSDTTTYAANDEVTDTGGTIRTITSAARASGGMVRLMSARCIDSSNVATKAQLLVYVFDTTSTPATDNAAFAPTDGVMNTLVAILPFNVWYPGDDTSGATGNAVSPYLGPPIEMKTSGSANLFFRVKVLNAYVPTSAEAFVFRFDLVQY